MSALLIAALAAQLGCPKPIPHKRHAQARPSPQCEPVAPRVVTLPAVEPDPEPIALAVVTRYLAAQCAAPYAPPVSPWWSLNAGNTVIGGVARATMAPEIDPGSGATALTLLAGALLLLNGTRPNKRPINTNED